MTRGHAAGDDEMLAIWEIRDVFRLIAEICLSGEFAVDIRDARFVAAKRDYLLAYQRLASLMQPRERITGRRKSPFDRA